MPQIPFIQWLKNNKLSYRTIDEYERYHKLFSSNPNEVISQELVNNFLMKNNNIIARAFVKNLKEYTLQNYIDELSPEEITKIYRISLGKSHIRDKPKREKKVIDIEDVSKIEEHFKKEITKIILNVEFYCALRVSELFFIKLENFNWREWEKNTKNNGLVVIRGKGGTIENVLIPADLMERINNYIETTIKEKPDYPISKVCLFNLLNYELPPEPKGQDYDYLKLKNDYIKKNYNIWNIALGLASEKALGYKITTHVLRRSFATHLSNNDWQVTEIRDHLRHKDISTTQIYIKMNKEKMSKKYSEVIKKFNVE